MNIKGIVHPKNVVITKPSSCSKLVKHKRRYFKEYW